MVSLGQTKLEVLYLGTTALLVVHEVDSAYWQEWKLFGMDGDIQGFVVANLLLVLPFLYGLLRLARSPRVGARFGIVLAILGVGAFLIHAWFLLQGHPEFRVPVSIAVLASALVTSVGLGWECIKLLRTPDSAHG